MLTAAIGLFSGQSWALDVGCSNPIVITPGAAYNGNTTGGPLHVKNYGCSSWSEAGPHRVHRITTNFIHGNITATLSNLGIGIWMFSS
jgi:hypothetical protein